jgi:hypothetical protein
MLMLNALRRRTAIVISARRYVNDRHESRRADPPTSHHR